MAHNVCAYNGVLAEKGADSLVIDCGGVGYELICSRTTISAAPRVGERMKCFTVLSVREDALELFGFATREEKALYEKLRAVSGIGPRTALNMLSALSVRELSVAIVTGDVTAISRAPGVGKKTAQRVVLELREKIDNAALEGTAALPARCGTGAGRRGDRGADGAGLQRAGCAARDCGGVRQRRQRGQARAYGAARHGPRLAHGRSGACAPAVGRHYAAG